MSTPPNQIWQPHLYDHNHAFVSKFGESLLEWVHPQPGQTLCDLGCGTGELCALLHEKGAKVLGFDSSQEMVNQAKSKYPHLHFEVKEATNFSLDTPCNTVLSNAVLHWIQDHAAVFKNVWNCLKPGGIFIAEFGGKHNIQTIVSSIETALDGMGYSHFKARNPWHFPSVATTATLLEAQGFDIKDIHHFERPTSLSDGESGLRNWVRMFGGVFYEGMPLAEQTEFFERVDALARTSLYQNQSWVADYKRLRFRAQRPGVSND